MLVTIGSRKELLSGIALPCPSVAKVMLRPLVLALALLFVPNAALSYRQPPAGKNATQVATSSVDVPSDADVARLRAQLGAIARGLEGTLSAGGGLEDSKVAPALQAFVKTLRGTVNQTATLKDRVLAMKKLQDAKAGISGLVNELTDQQESLMKNDEAQKESLLLGVLMTRQKEPMEQQLRILSDEEFAALEVSHELLAKCDPRTPLYKQVAEYMDKHPSRGPLAQADDKAAILKRTAANFEARADVLQHEKEAEERQQEAKLHKLDEVATKATSAEAQKLRMLQRKLVRRYKKWSELRNNEIDGLRDAVVAMRSGDVRALEHARVALKQAIKALQTQTGGFLHFLQLGHKLSHTDCPYCAAQCLEKCHMSGTPYVACLGVCTDAGNGE